MNSKIQLRTTKWTFILLCLLNLNQLFAATCGDVNLDNTVDIIDALMTAQYYVGLNPQPFDRFMADVDGDGLITIVDALRIAQYYVGLIPGFPGCEPTPTPGSITYVMQAEEAQYSSGSVDTNHAGYTGTGFVNTDNAAGEWIEWNFDLSADSTAECVFRYASASDARPMDLSINGSVVINLDFPATGAWTTWAAQAADTVTLSAGSVVIRLTATGGGGASNMDKMDITVTGGVIVAPTLPPTLPPTPTPTPTPVPTPTPEGWTPPPIQYLSGTGSDDTVQWAFYCSGGRNSGDWTNIEVPSNWELQGFGTYNYGHDGSKSDETGRYRHSFSVPDEWQDKKIILVFEGVMTDTEVWVNGTSAGSKHQGGFYRFTYDITNLIQWGNDNQLEVLVHKVSSNSSVEQAERKADYWVFGGIYRPVYLKALPQQHIERCAIDARADGRFLVDVYLSPLNTTGTLTATIDGPGLPEPHRANVTVPSGRSKITLETEVNAVKSWTAETPHLYHVNLSLVQNGEILHGISERFGFRTFEVRPGQGLYLNGRKIILKGVNRHSFWPDTGRCLNRTLNYGDVQLIKEMNMNAVRASHYPPDIDFLDACDELGLYVLDELAGWHKPYYDTTVGEKLVREMVIRDVNHPSILFWNNGNEGGHNRELDDDFGLYDPQHRRVLHPWENFNDVDTDHYEIYSSTLDKLKSSTIFLPLEFLHGLYDGGHGAALDDYWNATLASPKGAGGFLWVFADEGVVRTDQNGRIDTDGNHAPDGIVGPYHEKEGSFYTIKEIFAPIAISLDPLPENFIGTIPMENRYDFTNLAECSFITKLVHFPLPWEQGESSVLFSQEKDGPNVNPGQAGTLALDLPADWSSADILSLTATDPGGHEIWTWTWPIDARQQVVGAVPQGQNPVESPCSSSDMCVVLGDLEVHFDNTTGRLSQLQVKGKSFSLDQGPRLISGGDSLRELRKMETSNSIAVLAEYNSGLRQVRWDIYQSGWMKLAYSYNLNGEYDLMGVQFDYPENRVRAMRRLGNGPFRVYRNRLKGGQMDIWENPYKNHTPGATWDYPEFRGYYANWIWTVLETTEGRITLVNATDDLYLGLYRPQDGSSPSNTELSVPDTGLALLHGIPAIGTKSYTPDQLGPQGRKIQANGIYSGEVWLHFE